MDWSLLLGGVGAGITYGLTGFAKNKDEPFDFIKLGTTIVIGAISGFAMVIMNTPIDMAWSYVANLGIVPTVENVLKAIKRRLFE